MLLPSTRTTLETSLTRRSSTLIDISFFQRLDLLFFDIASVYLEGEVLEASERES